MAPTPSPAPSPTVAPTPSPTPAGLYPPEQQLSYVATNSDPRPGYLGSITDSTWGTRITRISNVHLWRNAYAKQQPWNADESLIFLGYGFRMLRASDYADLGQRATGVEYPVWSNIDPDVMWGASQNQPHLKRYSVATNAWTNWITFAGVSHISLGNYEGNISDNDARIALIYRDTAGTWGVIVANPLTGAELARLPIGTSSSSEPNNVNVSRSGAYVSIQHGSEGSGSLQGTSLYRSADLALIRKVESGRTHGDWARNAAGEDIYILHGGGGIRSVRASDGLSTTIHPSGFMGHIAGSNIARPGWVYLSSTESGTVPGYGQVFAIKTDGSQIVNVFGFHHSYPHSEYDDSPFAVSNRDGTEVMFGSRWHGSEIYGYVAKWAP